MRAGHAACRFGALGPPASLSFGVGKISMNARLHKSGKSLLVVTAIAIALMIFGAARFPESIAGSGLTPFLTSVGILLVYFAVGIWAGRASPRLQAGLAVGTVVGLSIAAIGVLYHIVEITTAVPPSVGAVIGGGMWGAMFLAYGLTCSITVMKDESIALGILSSVWCGMVYAGVLVASALAIGFVFMAHMQRILAPLYETSGMHDSQSFVVRNHMAAGGEHLLLVPLVAFLVGVVSAVACRLFASMKRQAALGVAIVAVLLFGAAIASIRFATSLERHERPPFIAFGLIGLAVTLASSPALLIAIRHRSQSSEGDRCSV
jgi:hypothetical protein